MTRTGTEAQLLRLSPLERCNAPHHDAAIAVQPSANETCDGLGGEGGSAHITEAVTLFGARGQRLLGGVFGRVTPVGLVAVPDGLGGGAGVDFAVTGPAALSFVIT